MCVRQGPIVILHGDSCLSQNCWLETPCVLLDRSWIVQAIEPGQGLEVSWVSPVPGDPGITGSNVLYTGLRISCCSSGLDGSLENLPRESPMPSGQGQGQGTEMRRLLVQQISPGRGVLRTGYSLHFRKGVRGLSGATSSSLSPILWHLATSLCVTQVPPRMLCGGRC